MRFDIYQLNAVIHPEVTYRHDNGPRFALEELRIGPPSRTDEMACGVAQWPGSAELPPISGHWQLMRQIL
jgi:hypothetical protein